MELKVEEFIKLRNFIYDKAGIFYETKKIYFVKKRLAKRMELNRLNLFEDYFSFLKFRDSLGGELQELLNLLTVNETYFYREENQLAAFSDFCLKAVLDSKRKNGSKMLKIWSAGCSTGEEPYSLAIMLKEKMIDFAQWNIEIIASDIDTKVLSSAEEGIYDERSVRNIPEIIRNRYFSQSDGTYRVSNDLKRLVKFKHLNLFDGSKMRLIRNIDFIFCRNVLIYFDDASKKAVVANFYDSLNPGGYIFLGHSESVTRIHTGFRVKRMGGLIVHQKPEI